MATHKQTDEALALMTRLRAVLTSVELECRCRETLDSALDRFATLEMRRLSRRRLAEARDQKERISAILGLLSDLDQLSESESDRTVFLEMALLFDEIGISAAAGAAALRKLDEGR